MTKNILHNIEKNMSSFSKGQKLIARFILENYDKAAFMTASKLGKTVQVSESTVVRFATQLGYEGYPSMQRALQEMIRGKLTSIQRIQASDGELAGSDLMTNVLQRDMEKIRMAIDQTDGAEFERVVDTIIGARRIYIVGFRSSSFLAGYLNFYFRLIFDNVTLSTAARPARSTSSSASPKAMWSSVSASRATVSLRSRPSSLRATAARRSSA